MNRRKLVLLLLIISIFAVSNLGATLWVEQHMDFDRKFFTTTFAFANTDKAGSWFMFIDLNTDTDYSYGYNSDYFEIHRDFNIGKIFGSKGIAEKLNLHLEYNGSTGATTSWLLAGARFFFCPALAASFSAKLPRNHDGSAEPDPTWQGTINWFVPFSLGKVKVTFAGFIDIWYETTSSLPEKKVAFLAEPQIIFNLGFIDSALNSFSIGSEIEITYNHFLVDYSDKIQIKPTLFIKYVF